MPADELREPSLTNPTAVSRNTSGDDFGRPEEILRDVAGDRAAFLPVIRSNALNERLESLLWAKTQGELGSDPRLLIVACRDDVDSFCANADVDPYFAELFNEVQETGIIVECLKFSVDEEGMRADSLIPCVC